VSMIRLWQIGFVMIRGPPIEHALIAFLAHPGPALLDVKVNRSELVFPSHVEAKMVLGTMLYGAKAVLSGRLGDVTDLLASNFIR
jgi:pyruvate dehydrogenase (quinone)